MRALGFEPKKEEIKKVSTIFKIFKFMFFFPFPHCIYLIFKKNISIQMIADVDREGRGVIEFPDFLDLMTVKMAERDPREEILKAFKLFDSENRGKIGLKDLKRVARELGESKKNFFFFSPY